MLLEWRGGRSPQPSTGRPVAEAVKDGKVNHQYGSRNRSTERFLGWVKAEPKISLLIVRKKEEFLSVDELCFWYWPNFRKVKRACYSGLEISNIHHFISPCQVLSLSWDSTRDTGSLRSSFWPSSSCLEALTMTSCDFCASWFLSLFWPLFLRFPDRTGKQSETIIGSQRVIRHTVTIR